MLIRSRLAPVRERDVDLHDEMPVARHVDRSVRAVAALDDAEERESGELALGVALLEARPNRGTLRGLLADGKRMEKAETSRIGELLERRRGTLVLLIARTLEERRVAREEVQVPVFDGHTATAQTRPTTLLS